MTKKISPGRKKTVEKCSLDDTVNHRNEWKLKLLIFKSYTTAQKKCDNNAREKKLNLVWSCLVTKHRPKWTEKRYFNLVQANSWITQYVTNLSRMTKISNTTCTWNLYLK